jgi:hypothetical protein
MLSSDFEDSAIQLISKSLNGSVSNGRVHPSATTQFLKQDLPVNTLPSQHSTYTHLACFIYCFLTAPLSMIILWTALSI